MRALGQGRLLADAGREVRVRPPQALGDHPRDRLDLALEPLVDDELLPGHARDHLDRSVVVRRAEAAGDEAEVRLEPLPERLLEILRAVADDRDPLGVEPEPHDLGGEEGPVPVLAVAADELAARDDDRRPRAGVKGVPGRCAAR